jgi:ArsR family transcriptional regulator
MSIRRRCPSTTVHAADLTRQAALFKALADPHRLTILAMLAQASDDVCVCEFTSGLPLNQPTVSHHLRVLREARLVTCERRGTWVYYRLAADARALIDAAIDSAIPARTPA